MRLVVVALVPAAAVWLACGGGGGFTELLLVPEPCVERGEFYPLPDEVAIAQDILAETTNEPLFDKSASNELAQEVAGVLAAVRAAYPSVADIKAAPRSRWQLGVGFRGPLLDRILALDTYPSGILVSRTGDEEFDRLAESLGLVALRLDAGFEGQGAGGNACFRELVNGPAAIARLEELESVENADINTIIGDGSAIDMRQVGGTWQVAVREGSGDCLAGCGDIRLLFLEFESNALQAVPEPVAASDPVFRHLVTTMSRGYREGWISPTPSP